MPIKSLKSAGAKALGQGLGADGEPKDAEFNQTTLLLHADGSEGEGDTSILGDPDYKAFKDNSTSTHDISVQGNAYGNNFSPYSRAEGYWSTTFNGNGGSYIIYQGYRDSIKGYKKSFQNMKNSFCNSSISTFTIGYIICLLF